MKNLLIPYPWSRVNDVFVISNPRINFHNIGVIKKDPLIKGIANEKKYRFSADFYQHIGVDIVTETVFEYPYCFVTEKTYRSMACLRPFILVGPYNTLNFLKSLGFKTFSTIIDESYDDTQHPEERFIKVCNSIQTFINRPIIQIQNDIKSIEAVLLHNQQTLVNLNNVELEKFKLKFQ